MCSIHLEKHLGKILFTKRIFCKNDQIFRYLSAKFNPEIPVITMPKYLEKNLGNKIWKEHQKVHRARLKANKSQQNNDQTTLKMKYWNKKVISWSGSKALFHYYGKHYSNPDNLPLIGKEFLKENSNGEVMTIHNFDKNNPSVMDLSVHSRSFADLGLESKTIEAIYDHLNRGHPMKPSTIQFGAIPVILKNKNVIMSAETGSGKTIAYLAPLIQMIAKQKARNQRSSMKLSYGLVVLPTRELAEQVGSVAMQLAKNTNVGVRTMIGGIPKQIPSTGMDLIVSTIGSIEKNLNNGVYSLRDLNHLVLDEADSLLDDSFSYETMELLEKLNLNVSHRELLNLNENDETIMIESLEEDSQILNGTQLICVSATKPKTLDSTIGVLLDLEDDVEHVSTLNLHRLHSNTLHKFYRVNRYKKDLKLMEFLYEDRYKKISSIIFANRTPAVDWLFKFLNENDFPCQRLTGGMDEERYNAFRLFQEGEVDILVASDLGSRGLDTIRAKHVINFDCPHFVADYIHRAGRTGRLGMLNGNCRVSTLVSYKQDAYMLMELERCLRLDMPIETVNANIKSQIRQRHADKQEKIRRNF